MGFSDKQVQKIVLYGLIAFIILSILASPFIVTFIFMTSFIWIPLIPAFLTFLLIGISYLRFTQNGKQKYQELSNQFTHFYDWLFYKSNLPRKIIWGIIYDLMGFIYSNSEWKCMNYGYAPLVQDGKLIQKLKDEDEDERFCLQLYHHCVTMEGKLKSLDKKTVVEVGCGRGGGLNYISTYLNPEKCIGVDFSETQIKFCKKTYSYNPKIEFHQGDSENLTLIPQLQLKSADIVINVESSHCYGDFEKFTESVKKVLKDDGYFVLTDFRTTLEYTQLENFFSQRGWNIILDQNITIQVLQGLRLDQQRRQKLIEQNVTKILRPFFMKFSGLENSRIQREFQEKQSIYFLLILQKKI